MPSGGDGELPSGGEAFSGAGDGAGSGAGPTLGSGAGPTAGEPFIVGVVNEIDDCELRKMNPAMEFLDSQN